MLNTSTLLHTWAVQLSEVYNLWRFTTQKVLLNMKDLLVMFYKIRI